MGKQIKDYLHLYPKVPIIISEPNAEPVFHYLEGIDWVLNMAIAERVNYPLEWVRLILRHLIDIRDEEINELWTELKYNPDYESPAYPNMTKRKVIFKILNNKMDREFKDFLIIARFLLSKEFDLFGLIDAGLAVDIKTLNTTHG